MNPPGHPTADYRPEIDGLRAVAVLQVVLYHAGAGMPAGFVGVDVFFVISGYLITRLLLREWNDSGRIDLPGFYARRVRRILPAAVLVTGTTLLFASALLPPDAFATVTDAAAAAALFVANVFFQRTTGGYFDPPSEEMPLLHLWSLSVEEQFYFVWPLLLLLVLRRGRPYLTVILGLFALASFVLAETWIAPRPEAAFYQMPARFWELAAGGIVATLPPASRAPRGLAGLGLLLVLAAGAMPFAHFPGAGALPAVLGSAVLLYAVHQHHSIGLALAVLRSAPAVGIGRVSYSFYLWHWPLLAFYRAGTVGDGSLSMRLLLCAAALLLAAASYRYVELPFRRRRTPARRLLLAGVVISAGMAVLAVASGLQARRDALGTDNPVARAAEADKPPDALRCYCQRFDTDCPPPDCASRPRTPPTIAIWGDSMAMAWKPLAWQLARRESASAISYARDLCPPLFGYVFQGKEYPGATCAEFVVRTAERARGLRVLFLVMDMSTPALASRADGIAGTLEALSPHVGRIVVLGPTPRMRDTVGKCIRSGQLDDCAIPRATFDAFAAPQLATLRAQAARFANVDVVDLGDVFCDARTCAPAKNGVFLYWDDHHVSTSAVEAFAATYLQTAKF